MTTFVILTPPDNPHVVAFIAAMQRVFPNAYYPVSSGQYFAVKQNATSQQITNELGGAGEAGKFIVVASGGYWGFYDKPLWEWLRSVGAE